MALPVSYFVRMGRPLTQAEREAVRAHAAKWTRALHPGSSGYMLEPVQLDEPSATPAPVGNGHARGGGAGTGRDASPEAVDRAFHSRMRQANLRTLVELALTLERGGRRPGTAEVESAFRTGDLRLVGRTHPGPTLVGDVLTLVEALSELEALLPEAEVRVHDGQYLRYVRPSDVDRAALQRDIRGR